MASRRNSPFNIDQAAAAVDTTRKKIAFNGISSTFNEKSCEYLCPICFELIKEAHITKCGHTFCYQCILKSVEINGRCPRCNAISLADQIFPNYLLNELITKYKLQIEKTEKIAGNLNDIESLRDLISTESQNLTLPDVIVMLEILQQRKQLLEAESCISQNKMLHDFLTHLLLQKEEQKIQIIKEIHLIKNDINDVEYILNDIQQNYSIVDELKDTSNTIVDLQSTLKKDNILTHIPEMSSMSSSSSNKMIDETEGFTVCEQQLNVMILQSRKRRMHAYFDDFVKCYFEARSQDLYFGENTATDGSVGGTTSTTGMDDDTTMRVPSGSSGTKKGLDVFRDSLIKFSRYSSLRPLATLNYASDLLNTSTIVSSIEFDKDNEFFAIAGVTKRIKVFDYLAVIRDAVDIHYPCVEMTSNSKISCIVWNSYQKGVLASSDYEGAVTIWDVETGRRTKLFQEHDKRCWSVDFNNVDTRLIASGSDDARVKLWSLNADHSIATLEVKANVCCVKFNPKSSCHVAFGSADHCVHYYDLRNTKEALCIFKGHKKAVSYVKFLNTNEIISASTDSQLKLWNINSPPYCLRSFEGHINEKNFVGLATDGDYISCGSEDNSLYVYYKGLPQHLFSIKLDGKYATDNTERISDTNEFVSAVCWRKQCNVIVAANSRGIIKILELF